MKANKSPELKALEEAVDLVGGQSELARRVAKLSGNRKIKQAHVWKWLNKSKKTPPDYVLHVESATELRISRHKLAPKLYPIESAA